MLKIDTTYSMRLSRRDLEFIAASVALYEEMNPNLWERRRLELASLEYRLRTLLEAVA